MQIEGRYINLARRSDRRDALLRNLDEFGYAQSISKIDGIEDSELPQLGCVKSHFFALSDLLTRSKADFLMIIEDDFNFSIGYSDFKLILTTLNESLADSWGVWQAYATRPTGYTFHEVYIRSKSIQIIRLLKALSALCYVVRRDYAAELLRSFSRSIEILEKNKPFLSMIRKGYLEGDSTLGLHFERLIEVSALDNIWVEHQLKHKFIAIDLEVGIAMPGFSDLKNSFRDGKHGAVGEGSYL